MEKYFNEKELSMINNAWENKKSIFVHKYKGLSNKWDLLNPCAIRESAKWYKSKEEFTRAIFEDSMLIGYIQVE